jgi:tetratricopeptide (TPR) repeat protein
VVGNLGLVLTDLGRLAEAAVHTGRAAEVFAELGSPAGEAINLANLGDIHHQLGDLDRAWKCFTEARARYRAVGDGAEANAVRGLAVVHRDAGRTAQARELAELALTQARESGLPGLEPTASTPWPASWTAVANRPPPSTATGSRPTWPGGPATGTWRPAS